MDILGKGEGEREVEGEGEGEVEEEGHEVGGVVEESMKPSLGNNQMVYKRVTVRERGKNDYFRVGETGSTSPLP